MLESALRISSLVDYCKIHKSPAIALCDHHNICGAVEFSQELLKSGIQPLLGLSLDVCFAEPNPDLPYDSHAAPLGLLVQDQQGYQNLSHLSSHYYLNGRAPISLEILCKYHQGLIILSGGATGFLGRAIDYQIDNARSAVTQLQQVFQDRLYIELTRQQTLQEKKLEPIMLDFAEQYQLPPVATNHCFYAKPNDHVGYTVLRAISTGDNDGFHKSPKQGEHYLKSPEQMKMLFADIPESLANSVHIAQRCHFILQSRPPILPKYYALDNKSEGDFITNAAHEKLQKKLEDAVFPLHEKKNYDDLKAQYDARLNYELGILIDKGFANYFLIVADFIDWAKRQNIPVGPGRGSGAGSLVAWVLGITDLDPIRWGLLFERFLNPERESMPDFDIDFCQDRRSEVIEYVRETYGMDKVAQIITFGSLKPRACVRDVGRVMGLPYGLVDRISKLIPDFTAHLKPLLSGKEKVEGLAQMYSESPEITKLLDLSMALEGLNRHASTHAAGIVIADQPLEQIVPLYLDGTEDAIPATQFNMKYVEMTGLVKFDFLGLRTLSVIESASEMIQQNRGKKIDISKIPLDDAGVYKMLASGDSFSVFQLESSGMRDVLKNMQPDRFEDLIAAVALYRPGPMENIPLYNARKNGKEKVKYLHPLLESVLAETYGIPVYQEQVMEMASILAGYSLGNADKLRRAMGKKDLGEMQAERANFLKGAEEKHNIDAKKAGEIFTQMEAFAGYGFNKSHAAAYALVAYQTAWLKHFYALEYYAAMLSYEMHNTTKIAQYHNIMRQQGIIFLLPDINQSDVGFTCAEGQENTLHYGLAALKNAGSDALQAIVKERKQEGAYSSLADFAERNCALKMNRRMLEALVKAGAFDALVTHRAQAFEAIDMILGHAASCLAEQNSNQNNLFFDSGKTKPPPPPLPEISPWGHPEMLRYELEAIGFYLSDHPLSPYRDVMAKLQIIEAKDLDESLAGKVINLAGIISSIRKIRTKTGKRMGFVEFSDMSGRFELALFEEQLSEKQELLESQQPLLVKAELFMGKSAQNEQILRLRYQELSLLDTNLAQHTKRIDIGFETQEWLKTIHDILTQYTQKGSGHIALKFPVEGRLVTLMLNEKYNLSPGLIKALKALDGVEVRVS